MEVDRVPRLQGGNNTSSILLTAAAQNFLCIKLAEQAGVVFTNPFSQWCAWMITPDVQQLNRVFSGCSPIIIIRVFSVLRTGGWGEFSVDNTLF